MNRDTTFLSGSLRNTFTENAFEIKLSALVHLPQDVCLSQCGRLVQYYGGAFARNIT
jgi:hypothetical protein